MDVVEGALANALEAFIGGTQPHVSLGQVHDFLECIVPLQGG
jgi:hypothetical protein